MRECLLILLYVYGLGVFLTCAFILKFVPLEEDEQFAGGLAALLWPFLWAYVIWVAIGPAIADRWRNRP